MTSIRINNIDVKFPFPPYDIQKNYMTKVIECLETEQNGILESPTGTGKTLSLLCAILAWLENRKKQYSNYIQETMNRRSLNQEDDSIKEQDLRVPTIIYSSRTHTQLHQAMQEMKKTEYNHMKACILGSREQMCINEEVVAEKNTSLKISMCRSKVKKSECSYYNQVDRNRDKIEKQMNIVDIEDIVDLGRCKKFCPYYMSRELKQRADVVFMPYNYLLDPKTKKAMGVEFEKDIIIFDEAHNIEKVCEESVSVQLTIFDIDSAIEDIHAILNLFEKNRIKDVSFTSHQLQILNEMFVKLKDKLESVILVDLALQGTVFDGDYIFTLLENAGIIENNYSGVTNLLDEMMDFMATTKYIHRSGYSLKIISNLLTIVFYKLGPEFRQKIKECFKVQFENKEESDFSQWNTSQFSQKKRKGRVLNFWCFSPGFAMNMLMDRDIHCLILTSGTLAPLQPLISELDVKIDVRIENPHIIENDQICVQILSKGPDNELLNSNFNNRNNPKYMKSLGLVISNLIRVIPDGVLIFFPSYNLMETSIASWQRNGLWDAISRVKPIFVEPKDKNIFKTEMDNYYAKIQDPSYKGAIFMGVCRGKVSEGLDFADINGRAVFITGLPYPPLKDPKIILKKQYLDFRHSKDKEYLKGDNWYSLEATRAINQAIGRVIRHKNDFGAIILLDSRFSQTRVKNNLSLWLRYYITEMKNFQEITRNLKKFFSKAQEKTPNISREILIQELNEIASTSCVDTLVESMSNKGNMLESPIKRKKPNES